MNSRLQGQQEGPHGHGTHGVPVTFGLRKRYRRGVVPPHVLGLTPARCELEYLKLNVEELSCQKRQQERPYWHGDSGIQEAGIMSLNGLFESRDEGSEP